jgi:hypothetical protein
MATYKIPTTVKITTQRIKDMLITALEGGSDYWLRVRVKDLNRLSEQFNNDRNMENLILAGASVPIYDAEGQDGLLGHLSMLNIIMALSAMAQGENIKEEKNDRLKEHFDNFINENDDAETADVIVQIAVMESVVYG